MTTAHKPTFHPAVGGEHQGSSRSYVPSQAYSSRDQPSHTKLKFRKIGQGSEEELKGRDLKAELEERERRHFQAQKALTTPESSESKSLDERPAKRQKTENSEEKSEEKSLSEEKSSEISSPPQLSTTSKENKEPTKEKKIDTQKKNPDADDTDSDDNDQRSNSEDSGSSESDDEEAELLKELGLCTILSGFR